MNVLYELELVLEGRTAIRHGLVHTKRVCLGALHAPSVIGN